MVFSKNTAHLLGAVMAIFFMAGNSSSRKISSRRTVGLLRAVVFCCFTIAAALALVGLDPKTVYALIEEPPIIKAEHAYCFDLKCCNKCLADLGGFCREQSEEGLRLCCSDAGGIIVRREDNNNLTCMSNGDNGAAQLCNQEYSANLMACYQRSGIYAVCVSSCRY